MPISKLPKCDRCNSRMIAKPGENLLWCQVCGHVRDDARARAALSAYLEAGGKDIYGSDLLPDVESGFASNNIQALLQEAWELCKAGKKRSARAVCHELLRDNHRNIDAYFILYHAAPTPLEKARHLASVLAIEPNHTAAKHELERLSKTLKVEVKPSFSTIFDHREVIDDAVEADADLQVCPMCAGKTLYVEENDVKCLSCGYRPKVGGEGAATLREDAPLSQTLPPDGGFHSLREALMQRQYGTGKQWIIAQRVLACDNCGAQLTLSGNMMVDQCAFCDSQHILVQDALMAFQEPDAVLAADLNEREALKAVWDSLPPRVRRMAFRHESVGIFLPYWNFRDPQESYRWNTNAMLVAGSNQPGSAAMEALEPFDLRYLRPYDQRYLASWSAELYTKDAIQASLEISAAQRDNLDYRLLLLPVWMTTIHLRGGDFLHSLVNAQTGKWWSPIGMIRTILSAPPAPQATPRPSESVIKPLQRRKK